MSRPAPDHSLATLRVQQNVSIAAPADVVFAALLAALGPQGQTIGGSPLVKRLEPWPGGRWYRDLDQDTGHLWGHVQVIKPPALLEICGPLFMSYPAVNHVQFRLEPSEAGTQLTLTHQMFGLIPPEHQAGIPEHWKCELQHIRDLAERHPADALIC